MAGDWLKLEANTPEKGEVLSITARMGWDDPDMTVGKLFRIWRWFDQQTVDGNAMRVTPALLDRMLGVNGFCDAMQEVGWLVITDGGVSLPKFDRHNGASAKSRALTAKRVAKHKGNALGNDKGNDKGNAESVSAALPREEKRREDTEEESKTKTRAPRFDAQAHLESLGVPSPIARDWLILRKGKRLAPTETAFAGVQREAEKAGISMTEALETCCARGWGGFEASWLLNRSHAPPSANPNRQEALEERNRAVALKLAREA